MQAQSRLVPSAPCSPRGDDLAEVTVAFARLKTSLGFLDLPAEIRNTIYGLISEPIAPITTPPAYLVRKPYTVTVDANTTFELPPIIHTCRQIRQEVLSLWLPKHEIITESMLAALRWISNPQQQLSSFVSSFDIKITRPAIIAEESQDAVLHILEARSCELKIDLKFSYFKYLGEGPTRGRGFRGYGPRVSFLFNAGNSLRLAPGNKDLIQSTLRAMFEHKDRLTLRDFILVCDQLANVPFHVVPAISSEFMAGPFSMVIGEQFMGSCIMSSPSDAREERIRQKQRGERGGKESM